MQEGRQVAAVSFPVPSVEAGPIGLQVGGTVVVSAGEMVEQLLAVPQEGLPTVKGGATGRDGSQPVVRTVEDGEPGLGEQVVWHGVVVGHVSSWWCSSVCAVGSGLCVNNLVDQGCWGGLRRAAERRSDLAPWSADSWVMPGRAAQTPADACRPSGAATPPGPGAAALLVGGRFR